MSNGMRPVGGFCLVLVAGAAFAHQGVQNPAVKARMDSMEVIQENTKLIGTMAKGDQAFDPDLAREAARTIAAHAAKMPALFEVEETDPVSEASPAIWSEFDDFVADARALEIAASGAAASIDTHEDLRMALAEIGQTCKSCHEAFRE